MGIIKNIKDRFTKQPTTKNAKSFSGIDIPYGSFLEYALMGEGRITSQQAMTFYRTCSSLATAVDKIGNAIEEIHPVLYEFKTDTYSSDHEVIKLLRKPNAFETYKEFMGKLARHWLLKHDSHVSLLGGQSRPPLEIYAIKPQLVSPQQNDRDNYTQIYNVVSGPGSGVYTRKEKNRTVHYYDGNLRELYHIQGFSSRDNDIESDSLIEAAALETKQTIQGRYHNLKLLKNGARLSLLVNFKDDDGLIDEDEHELRKQRINEQYAGSENTGTIGVISGGEVGITEMGVNNKDMDYAKLDQAASQAIFLRYGIPLPIVSMEKATYNNMEKAFFDFYENQVCVTANTLFSGLSKTLLPRYGLDLNDFIITYNPESIPVIMRQKLVELKERKDIGIETPDELRSLLPNREALKTGGDVVYQPATLIPIGSDPFSIEGDDD
ncbi:MAG: phage portal protein [Bacteroidetes bacterium]|nr:phage portal protein [Bacteroidota bacterium]